MSETKSLMESFEDRKPSTGSDSDLEIIENVSVEDNSNGTDSDSNFAIKNQGIEEVTIDDVKPLLKKQASSTDEVISKDSRSSLVTNQDQLEDSELESEDEASRNAEIDKKEEIKFPETNPFLSEEEAHKFPEQKLTEEEEELLYGQEARYNAIGNLIFFSVLIFTVPLAVMYIVYRVLVDQYNWPPDDASFWAGMTAIGVVIVIVAIFVWKALKEEEQAEVELKALKSQ